MSIEDRGFEHPNPDGPKDGNKADRAHQREYIVLAALVTLGENRPISCGLMDISVGGAKIKFEGEPPNPGDVVVLAVDALRVRVRGSVIRVFPTPTGIEVAVKFDRLYSEVPRGLLDYKLKSYKNSGFRRS